MNFYLYFYAISIVIFIICSFISVVKYQKNRKLGTIFKCCKPKKKQHGYFRIKNQENQEVRKIVENCILCPRKFVSVLNERRKICMKSPNTWCSQIRANSEKLENCDTTAVSIFLHATKIDKRKLCETVCINPQEFSFFMTYENFIREISKYSNVDKMCLVKMQDNNSQTFHVMALELRIKNKNLGFYVYSSWKNIFSLEWFLGLDKNPREHMPEDTYVVIFDEKINAFREYAGLMQFLSMSEQLDGVLLHVINVFQHQLELRELEYKFICEPILKSLPNE